MRQFKDYNGLKHEKQAKTTDGHEVQLPVTAANFFSWPGN